MRQHPAFIIMNARRENAMQTGIQISSLKPLLGSEAQVREAFFQVAALGCSVVQLQWVHPAVSPEEIAAALNDAGLRSVSVQDTFDAVRSNPEYYFRLNALTGGQWLCVSRVPEEMKSPAGLRQYAGEIHALMEEAREWGQRVCFHPVAGDYAPIGGVCPVDYLLEQLPDLRLCLDLFHLHKAGYPMPAWIQAHGESIEMVHFKDEKGNDLCPAGQGDICWNGVVNVCLKAGISYAFVEQEAWDRSPYACLSEALAWLNNEIIHSLEAHA